MDEASFTPGMVLAGKYELVRPLGSGGMGEVFEGLHQALGKRVAIKVLRSYAAEHPEYRKRFEREARAAASLRSPHVAQVTDVEVLEDGRPFIVMEYLEGRDLNDELELRGSLPVSEAVDYILQTCTAMSEAHGKGIVHRDLKPHNLYLTDHGGGRRVKVLDFGISKVDEGDASVTATSVAMGTPLYMAPEQMRSAKHVDARADIWSLGVILYELLAGRPPFDGENPTAVIAAVTVDTPKPLREHRPDVPEGLERVVMQMLEKNKALRQNNVFELGHALAPFSTAGTWEANAPSTSARGSLTSIPPATASAHSVDGLSATARRDTAASWSTHGARRALRRRQTNTILVTAGALTVLGIVGGVWATRDRMPEPAADIAPTTSPVVESNEVDEPDEVPAPEPLASTTATASAKPAAVPPPRNPVRLGPKPVQPPAPVPPAKKAPPPPPPPPGGTNPDLL